MILNERRVSQFLLHPDSNIVLALIYGPDEGLIRERVHALISLIAGEPPDPFRFDELTTSSIRAEPGLIRDRLATLPFGGGRQVVLVRDATDSIAEAVSIAVAEPPNLSLLLLQAGELAKKSKLRALTEASPVSVVIPCYADDEEALARVITETMAASNVSLAPGTLEALATQLGEDRGLTRRELEKFQLYVHGRSHATPEDVFAAVGSTRVVSLTDVAMAMAEGDPLALDRALASALTEGVSPIIIARAAAQHLHRLLIVRTNVDRGQPIRQAMERLRPPVFFQVQRRFEAQVRRWSSERLAQGMSGLVRAEAHCKEGIASPGLICRQALMETMRLASARST